MRCHYIGIQQQPRQAIRSVLFAGETCLGKKEKAVKQSCLVPEASRISEAFAPAPVIVAQGSLSAVP